MLAALMGLFLEAAAAAPTVVERSEYYEVAGSSAEELRAAIDRLRPKDGRGERHDAVTRWDVHWEYRYSSAAGPCALTSFATSVEVSTRLPKWSNRDAGSWLAERWDRYMPALEDHENGHAQIGLRAARAIQEHVSALDPARTCALLEDSIRSKGEALLDKHRSEDAEYDRRTKHGASQGVRFP
jgi:predicted secreted Zn-dependent protease